LPAHLEKIGATADRLRVRDLRDIHVLVFSSVGAIDYASVGDSFVRKCQKRLVDCSSIDDVLPATVSLEDLRAQYDDDRALADVAFDDAVATVRRLVSRLDELGRLPGIVPLPE
jgi:propanediol dehydratase small subunit